MKPNCYDCRYRGDIPGDAHSICHHPLVKQGGNAGANLNIKANAHGVKSGWFYWPINFDPVWLMNCDGFTKKEQS